MGIVAEVTTADVAAAFLVGLAASLAWASSTYLIDRWRMSRTFAKYAGPYRSWRKFPTAAGNWEEEDLEITVARNVLSVRFSDKPNRDIHGEIVMNRRLPTTGRGQYDHVKDEEQLWGFWDVQVKDENTLLVHTTYASTIDTVVLQGYIWTRR